MNLGPGKSAFTENVRNVSPELGIQGIKGKDLEVDTCFDQCSHIASEEKVTVWPGELIGRELRVATFRNPRERSVYTDRSVAVVRIRWTARVVETLLLRLVCANSSS